MTPLRQRFIDDMRLRNFSDNTIDNYVRAVRQYADHFGESPEHLGEEHLRRYLVYLTAEKKVAQGTY